MLPPGYRISFTNDASPLRHACEYALARYDVYRTMPAKIGGWGGVHVKVGGHKVVASFSVQGWDIDQYQ